MSNPGTPPLPRPEALKKLAQLRIEILKKEEEEEQWISGEELFTEGSSDEDDMAVRAKRKSNEKGGKKSSKPGCSKSKKQMKDEKFKSPNTLLPPEVILPTAPSKDEVVQRQYSDSGKAENMTKLTSIENESKGVSSDAVASSSSLLTEEEEIEAEISWRPKRGDENDIFTSIINAEKAYNAIGEKVDKMKKSLGSESSITSWINGSGANGFFGNKMRIDSLKPSKPQIKNKKYNDKKGLIRESCDVESAFKNIKVLDQLLDIITEKEKEARGKTIDVQDKLKDELCHLCSRKDNKNNDPGYELNENTANFLQLFSCIADKDITKENKIGTLNCENLLEDVCIAESTFQCKNSKEKVKYPIVNQYCEKDIQINEHQNQNAFSSENVNENFEDLQNIPSLNDNEKQRLQFLLKNIEDNVDTIPSDENNTQNVTTVESITTKPDDAYGINITAKQTLKEIDEKLKVFSKEKDKFVSLSFLPYSAYDLLKNDELCQINQEQCLQSIDELLDFLAKPTDGEIQPLTQEQIKNLITLPSQENASNDQEDENQQQVCLQENVENLNKMKPTQNIDPDKLKELVQEAKTSMPQFKFKY